MYKRQWWDFPDKSKQFLNNLANTINIELWVTFRDLKDFARKLHTEHMKNPPSQKFKIYGSNKPLIDVLRDPWFIKHFDYLGFLKECSMVFGEQNICAFEYQTEMLPVFLSKLGIGEQALNGFTNILNEKHYNRSSKSNDQSREGLDQYQQEEYLLDSLTAVTHSVLESTNIIQR